MKTECGAKNRAGSPCKRPPMPNGRCSNHGGLSPSGSASPSFRHGRYSKLLPARLSKRYTEALADAELISLRDELALLDVRLGEAVALLDRDDTAINWERLRTAWTAYKTAQKEHDYMKSLRAFETFEDLMTKGSVVSTVWYEIRQLIQDRVRVAESERRRLVDLQQTMTTAQAMALLAAVVDTVRRHVPDRSALAAISSDLERLVDIGPRALPVPRGRA